MTKIGVVGLGKMGMSHFSIVNGIAGAQPGAQSRLEVHACDTSKMVMDVVERYSPVRAWRDYDTMLDQAGLDAVIIAVQSRLHAPMVKKALERGLHVFCEKPFCLDWREAEALARLAEEKGLINQVGYHYRYVGPFQEVQRLVAAGAIGDVTHVLAEAYGPVVLKPKGSTWRTQSTEGGGCLYDYAAHPINLVNWYFGLPSGVSGTILGRIFSADTDDEVYSTFTYPSGLSVQLSVNWSDDSYRKMSTKISLTGTRGRITADRLELQAYLREPVPGYLQGWNVKYITDLTQPVGFYLRGEEYSAQIEDFVAAVRDGRPRTPNTFAAAAETDRTMAMMLADRERGAVSFGEEGPAPVARPAARRRGLFGLLGVAR